MQTRPGVEAKLVSISLVWRRKRPSKETVAYIHTNTHRHTKSMPHSNIYTNTHTHTPTVAHAHTNRERERETGYHMNKTHTDTHMKNLITHGCLHTHIHT